ASLSLWKYGDVMGRTPLYRKELCFTSRGENSFFMITNGRGTTMIKKGPSILFGPPWTVYRLNVCLTA
ncbi:MAG: hypothetical protein M1491_07035, partial [Deltaproteobacteria bacterium]|nr:hypothetical protein [Deltaproteobacteria bacterium]